MKSVAGYGRKRRLGRKIRRWRLAAGLLAAVAIGVLRYWPSDVPDHVDGRAKVIDGDSLRINGEEIRLVGVDAPESDQSCRRRGSDWKCGKAATRALRRYINGRSIRCDVEGVDKYDRLLAVCHRGKTELNSWLVVNGWAVSYGGYRREERTAEAEKRGIWASEFISPREWRDEHLGAAVAAAAS